MSKIQRYPELSETQIKRQKRGAVITALVVGGFALGIFLLTLYMNSK